MSTKTREHLTGLKRRKRRIRKKIRGTALCPRLSVYRSLNHIYAQLIDDENSITLLSANSSKLSADGISNGKVGIAGRVGTSIAEAAMQQGIKSIVFDRNGREYHGRVKEVAEAVRKVGLKV